MTILTMAISYQNSPCEIFMPSEKYMNFNFNVPVQPKFSKS